MGARAKMTGIVVGLAVLAAGGGAWWWRARVSAPALVSAVTRAAVTQSIATAQTAPQPVAPVVAPSAADRARALLAEALTAQSAREWGRADSLYSEALALEPALKGVIYQRAVAAFGRHDFGSARMFALVSVERDEEVAASYGLLGTMAGLAGDHAAALLRFWGAAMIAPTDPLPAYNASESLRHLGRDREAVAQLREAARLKPGELLYALKLRLARIAAGEERELEAEARRELGAGPLTADWAFVAAAVFLKTGRSAEAARMLAAARQVVQPGLFASLLEDPLFKRHAVIPEIAPFYPVVKSAPTPPTA